MRREFDVIITFQSKASGDVIMFGDVAHHMMKLMGKDITAQGIVTVEQLPDAIARLRAAIVQDKETHQRRVAEASDQQKGAFDASPVSPEASSSSGAVSLTQRAIPLLELLERSLRRKTPVLWGV